MGERIQRVGLEAVFDVRKFNDGFRVYQRGLVEIQRQTESAARTVGRTRDLLAVGFGSALGFAALTQVNAVINAVQRLGAEVISAVREFERLQFSMEAVFAVELVNQGQFNDMQSALGESEVLAQQYIRALEQLAIFSPFTTIQISNAFRLLNIYGFMREEALALTKGLVDVAAAFGLGEDNARRAALALGQIRAEGRLLARDAQQLVQAGIPIYDAIIQKTGLTIGQIQQLQRTGIVTADLTFQALAEWMDQFEGSGVRVSKTLNGIISSLQDIAQITIKDLFTNIFDPLIDPLFKVIETLSGNKFRAAVVVVAQDIGKALVVLLRVAKGAFEGLLGLFRGLTPQMVQAALAFGVVTAAVTTLATALGITFVAINLLINPFTVITAALGAFAAAYVTNFNNIATITNAFVNAINAMVSRVNRAIRELGDFFAFVTGGIITDLNVLEDRAVDWGVGFVNAFSDGIASAVNIITGVVDLIGDAIAFEMEPSSPPRFLSEIGEWGRETAQEFVDGFNRVHLEPTDRLADAIRKKIDQINFEFSARPNKSIVDPTDEVNVEPYLKVVDALEIGSRKLIATGANVVENNEEIIDAVLETAQSMDVVVVSSFSLRSALDAVNGVLARTEGLLEAVDFGTFRNLSSAIQGVLNNLERLEQISEIDVANFAIEAQEILIDVITDVRRFGDVTVETMQRIDLSTSPVANRLREFALIFDDAVRSTQALTAATNAYNAAQTATRVAQRELNALIKEYDARLKPLRDRFDEISEQRQLTEEEDRIRQLNRVINNAAATAAQREDARAEIEEIRARQALRRLERERDAAVDAKKEEVDTVRLQQEAARDQLEAARAIQTAVQQQVNILQERLRLEAELLALFVRQRKAQEDADDTVETGNLPTLDPAEQFAEFQRVLEQTRRQWDETLSSMTDKLNELNEALPSFLKFQRDADGTIPLVQTLTSAFAGLTAIFVSNRLISIITGIGTAFLSTGGKLRLLTNVVGIFAAAYTTNVFGIRDATQRVFSVVNNIIARFIGEFERVDNSVGQTTAEVERVIGDVSRVFEENWGLLPAIVLTNIRRSIDVARQAFGTFFSNIRRTFQANFFGIGRIISNAIGLSLGSIVRVDLSQAFSALSRSISTNFDNLGDNLVTGVGRAIGRVFTALASLFQSQRLRGIITGGATIIAATIRGGFGLIAAAFNGANAILDVSTRGLFTVLSRFYNRLFTESLNASGRLRALVPAFFDFAESLLLSGLNLRKNAVTLFRSIVAAVELIFFVPMATVAQFLIDTRLVLGNFVRSLATFARSIGSFPTAILNTLRAGLIVVRNLALQIRGIGSIGRFAIAESIQNIALSLRQFGQGGGFTRIFSRIFNSFRSFITFFTNVNLKLLFAPLEGLNRLLRITGGALRGFQFKNFLTGLANMFRSIKNVSRGFGGFLNPINLVIAAIDFLVFAFQKSGLDLREILKGISDSIRTFFDDPQKAFDNIKDRIREFIDDVGAAITSFQRFGTRGPVFQDFNRRIGEAIRRIGGSIADSIRTFWIPVFFEWIGKTINDTLALLQPLATLIGFWITETATFLRNKLVNDWIPAFTNWWTENEVGKKIVGFLAEGLEQIGEWITSAATWLFDKFQNEWIPSFVDWIQRVWPGTQEQLLTWLNSIGTWVVGTALPWLIDRLLALGTAFLRWWPKVIADTLPQLASWIGNIITWIIGTGIPLVFSIGPRLINALVGWISGREGSASDEAPDRLQEFLEALSKAFTVYIIPALFEVGGILARAVWDGLVELWTKVTSEETVLFLIELKDNLLAAVPIIASGLAQVGKNIWDGIIGGFKSQEDEADEVSGNFIDSWISGWNKKAEAASPSRLFAREVGAPMAEGVLLGFNQTLTAEQQNIAENIRNLVGIIRGQRESTNTVGDSLGSGINEGIVDALAGNNELQIQMSHHIAEMSVTTLQQIQTWGTSVVALFQRINTQVVTKTLELRIAVGTAWRTLSAETQTVISVMAQSIGVIIAQMATEIAIRFNVLSGDIGTIISTTVNFVITEAQRMREGFVAEMDLIVLAIRLTAEAIGEMGTVLSNLGNASGVIEVEHSPGEIIPNQVASSLENSLGAVQAALATVPLVSQRLLELQQQQQLATMTQSIIAQDTTLPSGPSTVINNTYQLNLTTSQSPEVVRESFRVMEILNS